MYCINNFRFFVDEPLAEDAVQDAFLQLIKHEVHFDNAGSDDCKRYIITVIKNASINIYNKRKNENKVVSYPEDLEAVCDSNSIETADIHDGGAEVTPLMKLRLHLRKRRRLHRIIQPFCGC